MIEKPDRQLARHTVSYIEGQYAIEVDVFQVETGSWGALVRLRTLSGGTMPDSYFVLNRTFEDRALALSNTLAVVRLCVKQFEPATAAIITRRFQTDRTET